MAIPPGYGAPQQTPVAGSLQDPWARLQRASDQIESLDRDYGISPHLKPYRLRSEESAGVYRFYLIDDVAPVDEAVPFIVSECVFNIRSTLDQLVYQLHLRRFRGVLSPNVARASAFPIVERHSSKARTDPAKWAEIRNLGRRQRELIVRYQPFINRADKRFDEARSTLHVLNTLCNVDKHRRLHVVRAMPAPVSKPEAAALGFRQTIWNNTRMKRGDLVETWTPLLDGRQGPPPESDQFSWPHAVIDLPELDCVVYVHAYLRQALGHVAEIVRRFNTTFGYVGWQRFRSPGSPGRQERA